MNESDRARDRIVSDEIRLLQRNLQIVRGGIVVAAAALHYQNGDRDKEIAAVLEHLVGDRLADQIERAGRLLETLRVVEPQLSSIDERDAPRDEPHEVRERAPSSSPAYIARARATRLPQRYARIARSRGVRLECCSALQQQE